MNPLESKFRRDHVRSLVTPASMKGLVTEDTNQHHQPLLVWDMSDQGLGIWSTAELAEGQAVTVTIAKPEVLRLSCEVRWCSQAEDGFHIGLKVMDNLDQLRALHSRIHRGDLSIVGE